MKQKLLNKNNIKKALNDVSGLNLNKLTKNDIKELKAMVVNNVFKVNFKQKITKN